jgi:hypothetical protein
MIMSTIQVSFKIKRSKETILIKLTIESNQNEQYKIPDPNCFVRMFRRM